MATGLTGKRVGQALPITPDECTMVRDTAIGVLAEGGVHRGDERAAGMFRPVGGFGDFLDLANARRVAPIPDLVTGPGT